MLCLVGLLGTTTSAQPLNPLDFMSLGTLNLSAGDYTFDTDTLTLFDNAAPGVPLFTGVADDQGGRADYLNGNWVPGTLGIPEIAVFTFDGIDLQPSANVTINGRRAIALLSQGDATIGTALSVDGKPFSRSFGEFAGGVGGPGGFDGANGFPGGVSEDLSAGDGPGGGLPLPDLSNNEGRGGNAGFGGNGRGTSIDPELQGQSYGDLAAVLQGGSGGANSTLIGFGVPGAGGGGAIEINATESLRIDAAISASSGSATSNSFGANGSGGGIRLIGSDVAIDAPVVAIGGSINGGGGGGRVYVEGLIDSVGLTIGEPTLAATADIDVNSTHLDNDGNLFVTASLDNVGVITLAPATTLVAAGENIIFGQGVPIAAPTDTVNYEILVRDARFQSGATGTIEAGGYSSRYAIELAGETATLTGPGTLTNENQITGTGRVEVATINAAGGTINATNDALVFTQTVTNTSGGQINAIVSTLSFDAGLDSDGQLNLINSTVNGDVTNNGVASLAGTNTFTGNVSGNGTFTGTGTAAFAGTLAPGNSPGLLTFEGDLDLEPTATLEIELGGTTPGVDYDRVEVGGFATLEGTLEVTLVGGFVPEAGDSFGFLFASGAFDASFAAISLPDLSGQGLGWQLNPGGATLFLEVVAALAGDFNLDGTVDAADYTVWRAGLGTTFTEADYAIWRTNYGATSSATTSQTVPEPTAGLLSLIAIGAGWLSRRRMTRARKPGRHSCLVLKEGHRPHPCNFAR